MKQRLISALILLLILIPLILIGGLAFKICLSIIGVLAMKELLNVLKNDNMFIKLSTYLIIILYIFWNFEYILCISFLLFLIPIIFLNKKVYDFKNSMIIVGITSFLGFVLNLIYKVRIQDINLFLFIILVPILCDTFAYISGKNIGKHKLIPNVSPNKTIEGSLIGTLVSVIFCSLFYLYQVDPAANIIVVILITLILNIFSQLGDLFFSAIKREYGIKDFSNLMPGHGGILDRFDSLFFVTIVYYLISSFL